MIAVCLLMLSGVLSAQGNSGNAFERVKEVQERNTAKLMAKQGVIGTAIGLNEQGRNTILVLLDREGIAGVPKELEGVPVQPIITGRIEALVKPAGKPGGSSGLTPTSKWPIPVPIGVSTGNAGECSAGTIGCRVKDGSGNVYALSNNHVYALENSAPIGSTILQPGLYDTQCVLSGNNVIGTLASFVPIVFSGNNTVDCAMASTTTGMLGKATPPNIGYGTPKSATVAARLNMAVQKFGRTTSLTKGTITGVNATVNVGYSGGTATFVNQTFVQSRRAFIKAGDSGSLLVTDPGRNPVGLLFAGNSSGTFAVANNIYTVLLELGVTIDGE